MKFIIPHIQLITVTLIYAITFSLVKMVTPEFISASSFSLLRVFSGTVFFAVVCYWIPKVTFSYKDWWLLFFCGILGPGFSQLMYIGGLELTTPISAAVIMPCTPIIVYVISILSLKEKPYFIKIIGILMGFLGVIFLILLETKTDAYSAPNPALGNLFLFFDASAYAVYLILAKYLLKRYSPYIVLKWVYAFGLLFIIPFGISNMQNILWSTIPMKGYLVIGFVLLFTSCFVYLLEFSALKKVSPTILSTYIYLQPVFAAIIAILLGSDKLTLIKVITFLLIALGVYLVSSPKKKLKKSY